MKNKLFSKIGIALVSMAMAIGVGVAASNTKTNHKVEAAVSYIRLESIDSIDESAEYVLGIKDTGFHTKGIGHASTSGQSWGYISADGDFVKYKLVKGEENAFFRAYSYMKQDTSVAEASRNNTTYIYDSDKTAENKLFLSCNAASKFKLVDTEESDNNKLVIGANYNSTAIDYAVAYSGNIAYHIRLNTNLRVYNGTTGNAAYFYKVVEGSVTFGFADKETKVIAFNGTVTNVATGESLGGNEISYSSSNESVATVNSSGVVTAVGFGKTTITASVTVSGTPYTDSYDVNVVSSEAYPYNVAQARAAIDGNVGKEGAYAKGIVYKVDSFDEESHSLTYWISEDGTSTSPLEVYKGKGIGGADYAAATDVKVGDFVVVTGTLKKYSSTYEFDAGSQLVSTKSVSSIAIKAAPTKVTYNSGEALNLTGLVVTATYEDSSTIDFTYSAACKALSFNPEAGAILRSTNDKVTISVGDITIDQPLTVNAVDAVISVTVAPKEVELDVATGETQQLTPTVDVEGNAATTVTYVSDKPEIASVSETGLVTALKRGKAIITVTSTVDENKKDTCNVIVTDSELLNFSWNLEEQSFVANPAPTADLVAWASEHANMTLEKGESSTAANNYLPNGSDKTHTRFYSKNVLTITPADAHIIEYVEFTGTSSSSSAGELQSGTWTNATATLDGRVVTVIPTDMTKPFSVVVHGACRFVSVKVFYKPIVLENVNLTITEEQRTFTAGNKFAFNGTLTATYNCVADAQVTPTSFHLNTVDGTEINANTVLTHEAHNGKTVHVVYTENNVTKSASFELIVNYKAVASIELDRASATLGKSGTVTLTATVADEFADQTVTWTTSDDTVATVSASTGASVTVTASSTKTGDATITATAVGGLTATCAIKVSDDPIVELDIAKIGAFTGDNDTVLTATATNFLAAAPTFTWASSAETVATVTQDTTNANKASVHIVGAGDAIITVTATDGAATQTANCTVTVTASEVKTITLASSVEDGKLYLGTTKTSLTLTPTVTYVGHATQELTWSSSDATVASVNNGAVTALKAGTATITATSVYSQNKSASFNVTVLAPDSLKLVSAPTKLKYVVGETFSSEGLVVKGVYGEEELDITGYVVSSPDMSTAGKKTVTVSLLGKEASFEINVITREYLTQVLGESDLVAGDKLLVVAPKSNDSGYAAMTSEINNTYLKPTDVTIGETGIDNVPVYECLVTLGGQKDAWTLANAEGKLLGVSADKKVEWVDADSTVVHTWKISVNADGSFTIESTDATLGKLQYNKSSPRFVNYASGSQANPFLYKVGAKTLAEFKTAASAEIDAYAASKGQSNYSSAGWTEIQSYVTTGKSALENAKSVADINKILSNTKELIDLVKTKAVEELETAKANAIEELTKYYNDIDPTKYTQENVNKLASELNKGKEAINAATSVAAVNAALTNAKASLDAVEQIPAKKGCGGSIAATSIILSTIALAGAGLLVFKKKKED